MPDLDQALAWLRIHGALSAALPGEVTMPPDLGPAELLLITMSTRMAWKPEGMEA